MRQRFLVLGGLALVCGVAVAAAAEWSERDVAAAEHYRELERERAERYRAEVRGGSAARIAVQERPVSRPAPVRTEPARSRPDPAWWDKAVAELVGPFDLDALRGWAQRVEGWAGWCSRELAHWRDLQTEWKSEPGAPAHRFDSPRWHAPPHELLPVVPIRFEPTPEDTRRLIGIQAAARRARTWWSEERTRLRLASEG
jgi:hypothetical protein